MGILYGTLISTYIFSLMSRLSNRKKKILSMFFVALVVVIIVLVSGLRDNIGDTGSYMNSYKLLNNYTFSFKGDWGFALFQYFLHKISEDPQILIFVTALITTLMNIKMFYKYISYLELEVYMYIASGYFTVTMNGLRQSLVAAIVFAATTFIERGNFVYYIVLVLLITPFHQSVLIMIPVYFIVRSEAWSKTTISIIVVSSVGFLCFSLIFPVLLQAIKDTNYGYYADNLGGIGGSSFIRVIVNAVPVILAYLTRDKLKKIWPQSNIFINMSLINLIFVTFGMYYWIFNRFTIYFQLYNFVLVPFIIKNCFKGKERRLIYYLFVLCFFGFFYREQVIGLNIKYNSKYLNPN